MEHLRNLPSLVRKHFRSAQETGELTFYPTRVSLLQCDGVVFQVRYSPALTNKPKSNKNPSAKPIDPFENPPKGLFVTELSKAHYLVLNKFPVIPDHFILATTAFKKQTNLLEEDDIAATYACLKTYRENGEDLFGFFNSGEHSGASQPHRHIQFLPVNSMRSGVEEGTTWNVLADNLAHQSVSLPFIYFSKQLQVNVSPAQLHSTYKSLYEQACLASGVSPDGLESQISYNMGFTDRSMVLCPRISEGSKIASRDGHSLGPISLNGTVLGGTLLVKSEEEWNAMCDDASKLYDVLHAIGIPKSQERL